MSLCHAVKLMDEKCSWRVIGEDLWAIVLKPEGEEVRVFLPGVRPNNTPYRPSMEVITPLLILPSEFMAQIANPRVYLARLQALYSCQIQGC